ncbi:geraniol 8-hydroxylase-like [Sesamum indicum]|uniref:Geraniol 8-hydroxylase-like n=1 Tax=Sesamum indicum TaxID=4182 RepID=A0A6I9SVT8_SESIN|nr:geraniol 8-hydroxylase-like [Sesamum indicum]
MIEPVNEARQARQPLDVGRLGFDTKLNFLSNMMFSSNMFNMNLNPKMEVKELIGDLIEFVGKHNVANYLPFLKPFDPQGIRRGLMLLYERLWKLLDVIIEQRIKHMAYGVDRYGDSLDVLLDHTKENGPLELNYQSISVLLMDVQHAKKVASLATRVSTRKVGLFLSIRSENHAMQEHKESRATTPIPKEVLAARRVSSKLILM